MTDDYKKGLITGLAMQPLCVAESSGEVYSLSRRKAPRLSRKLWRRRLARH